MKSVAAYEQWHSRMAASEADRDLVIYPWHHTALKLLPDLNGKRVLEIGCGRGDFARLLARLYPSAEIIATDFSASAIGIANSRSVQEVNVTFQVADAQALPFDDEYFDYAVSCECLEHVPKPLEMLLNLKRCLKRKGEFIITTENYFNAMILAWLKAWLEQEPFDSGSGVQPIENFFVFWKVKKIILESGLRITHMESNHFIWLLLPRCAPDTFFTEDFANSMLKRLFRPFGRHFTYQGVRP